MPKRLARKPSTSSLMPAARKRTNAIRISPAVIAQTTTGTSRMRPSVMRFGILKSAPRLGPRASLSPHWKAHMWPCEDQYSRDQAIAQARIPKYRSARANEGRAMAETGLTYAEAGVDLDTGNRLVEPFLGSTARVGAVADRRRLDL